MNSSNNENIEPFLTNKFNENYLYSVNRNSFTQSSSTTIYKKHFQQQLNQKNTFYVVLGSDSGLLIRFIDQHFPEGSCFLFIELDEHVEKISSSLPKLENSERIQVSSLKNWKETAKDLEVDTYIYLEKVCYIKSLSAIDLHNIEYHYTDRVLEAELQETIFHISTSLRNQEFIKQQLANVSENITPVSILKKKLIGKTCIILAGGPSLDESLEWVKKNRTHLVVIAVSRISKRLQFSEITPDIVVAVDPIHNSFEVSREMLLFPPSTLFIHSNNVNSGLPSQWSGKSLYLSDILPWESNLNCKNFDGEGPTVTNTAISIAIFMGSKSLLLLGVDLCHSKLGVSHASKSTEAEITGENLSFIGPSIQTYAGDTVQTTVQMILAGKAINQQAKDAKKNQVSIFNLSKNAARWDAIEFRSPSSIQLEITRDSFCTDFIDTCNDKRLTHSKSLLKDVSQMITNCKSIHKLAKKALAHNVALFSKKGSEQAQFIHKIKMDNIEKQIDTKYKCTASFIKEYGIQFFIKCVQPTNKQEWDDNVVEETGMIYYKAYIKSSEQAIQLLTTTKNRLLSRIDEYSLKPDIKKIISQWHLDNQPGRYHAFKSIQKSQSKKLSHNEKLILEKQHELFNKLLKNDTSFKKNLAKVSPLKGIKTKVLLLFKQQDIESLKHMTQGLYKLAEKNGDIESASYYYLSQAYLLSLTQQYQEALLSFEEVGADNLEEDELKQIAHLALKLRMPDLAESSLAMLINFNDVYLPRYAQLLEIIGKEKLAIDAYIQYLETYPKDEFNWVELAELFNKVGAKESAQMAYIKVIELSPDNQIAQEKLFLLQNRALT